MTFPELDRSRAILVGAHSYEHITGQLPQVKNNVAQLRRLLRDTAVLGLPARNIQELLQPKREHEVLDLVYQAGKEELDTLLFYYAGHGIIGADGASDLRLALPGSRPIGPSPSVRYSDIRNYIRQSAAARKIVILDCCYSGRAASVGMNSDAISGLTDIEGACVLTATADTVEAVCEPGSEYSAFTGELISLLDDGLDLNGSGPQFLDAGIVHGRLKARLLSKGLPEPRLNASDQGYRIILARNRAYQRRGEPDTDHDSRTAHSMTLLAEETAEASGDTGALPHATPASATEVRDPLASTVDDEQSADDVPEPPTELQLGCLKFIAGLVAVLSLFVFVLIKFGGDGTRDGTTLFELSAGARPGYERPQCIGTGTGGASCGGEFGFSWELGARQSKSATFKVDAEHDRSGLSGRFALKSTGIFSECDEARVKWKIEEPNSKGSTLSSGTVKWSDQAQDLSEKRHARTFTLSFERVDDADCAATFLWNAPRPEPADT